MKRKVDKFKSFAHDYMRLTPYCCDPSKINEECGTFDYYIAGGDQIWNTGCFEFEWYYYLDFVRNGKKIAYAPSMGPNGRKTIPAHLAERVRREVKTYQAVAVRDSGTAAFFDSNLPVVLDPTMLLDVEEWNKLAGDSPLIKASMYSITIRLTMKLVRMRLGNMPWSMVTVSCRVTSI